MKRWKKRAGLLLSLFLLLFPHVSCLAREKSEEPDKLHSQAAVLMDADSGRVLFSKNGDEKKAMASTTKIMTCILALEQMEESQKVQASANAAKQPKVHLGMKEGEEFYLKDLLYSLMLESHNDSAVAVAEGIAGSVEEFAKRMNAKAKEIGCEDTHFVTPNGIDGQDDGGIHSTTAKELALIMRYCIMQSPKKDEFLSITRTWDYHFQDVEGKRDFTCTNHNAFLNMMDGALSGKTGFTADAGYCYVGALRDGDRTFIVALLACGWPNNKGYKWEDAKKLMQYGLDNYQYREIEKQSEIEPVPIPGGVTKQSAIGEIVNETFRVKEKKQSTLSVLMRNDEDIRIDTIMEEPLKLPIKKGQVTGKRVYSLNGLVLEQDDIVAEKTVEKKSWKWAFGCVFRMFGFQQDLF